MLAMVENVSYVCQHFSLKEEMFWGLGKDRRLSKVRTIAAWLFLDSKILTLLSVSVRELERKSQTDIQLSKA